MTFDHLIRTEVIDFDYNKVRVEGAMIEVLKVADWCRKNISASIHHQRIYPTGHPVNAFFLTAKSEADTDAQLFELRYKGILHWNVASDESA